MLKESSTSIGTKAEEIAKRFLIKKGLKFVFHQFKTKCGEIDLIMLDKEELVIAEVRFRKSDAFGTPEETVTRKKQQKLIRTALLFQQVHPWSESFSLRFDIISILGNQLDYKITWIPNAFGVE